MHRQANLAEKHSPVYHQIYKTCNFTPQTIHVYASMFAFQCMYVSANVSLGREPVL